MYLNDQSLSDTKQNILIMVNVMRSCTSQISINNYNVYMPFYFYMGVKYRCGVDGYVS